MAKVSEFKGHSIITLGEDEEYPFSFGVKKAEMILENLEEIKTFVEEYGELPENLQDSPKRKNKKNSPANTQFPLLKEVCDA